MVTVRTIQKLYKQHFSERLSGLYVATVKICQNFVSIKFVVHELVKGAYSLPPPPPPRP